MKYIIVIISSLLSFFINNNSERGLPIDIERKSYCHYTTWITSEGGCDTYGELYGSSYNWNINYYEVGSCYWLDIRDNGSHAGCAGSSGVSAYYRYKLFYVWPGGIEAEIYSGILNVSYPDSGCC